MIVMKFGGSSLASASQVRAASRLIRAGLARHPLVVVSALGGTTDRLAQLALLAREGHLDLESIKEPHRIVLAGLGLPPDLLEEEWEGLASVLLAIEARSRVTPWEQDMALAFGERAAARLVAAHLRHVGIPARAHRASDLGLLTESQPGGARPLPESIENLGWTLSRLADMPVITGFISQDLAGRTTILGRNGSDETATILACAVSAEEIQIWTDVDGVMTADPRLDPNARLIPHLTYAEAARRAARGQLLLHPRALERARGAGIPLRIRNTSHPELPGTLICG